MKKLLFLSAGLLLIHLAAAQQLRWHWAVQATGAQNNHVCAAVCDTAGNIFLSGSFADTIRFENILLPPYGGQDLFIAKFDPHGAPIWAKAAGSTDDDYPTAMTLSPHGDLIVAGIAGRNADFGGQTVGTRKVNLFISCYTPDGDIKWAKSYGAVRSDYIKAMTTDSAGHIFLAGYFSRELDFDGALIESSSLSNALVVCLDSLGQTVWAQQFYSEYGENRVTALCYHDHSLWIAGICNAPTDVYGTIITPTEENATAIFTARCDEVGNIDNVYTHLSSANADISSIAMTEDGQLILGGNFSGYLRINNPSLNFMVQGNPMLVSLPGTYTIAPLQEGFDAYGNQDMFLAAINNEGKALWINQIGSPNYDNLLSMVYHPWNHIIITGLYAGTLIANMDTIGINNAYCDVFTVSYSSSGQIQEINTMGGTSEEYPQTMTFDKNGHIFLAGLFRDTTTLQYTTLYAPSGTQEVFLAKLHHCNQHRVVFSCDTVVTEGDMLTLGLQGNYTQYLWDNGGSIAPNYIIYYSKTYQVLVSDSMGCVYRDSITILQAPVVPQLQIRAQIQQPAADDAAALTAYRRIEAKKEDGYVL